MSINDSELRRVNEDRRRKGQQPLTRNQAVALIDRRPSTDTSATDFLLGLSGVPWPSAAGLLGYTIHESNAHSASASTHSSISSGGGDFGGGGSSSSYDSGSSSSSSYDSGSSSSGGGGFD